MIDEKDCINRIFCNVNDYFKELFEKKLVVLIEYFVM